MPTFGQSPNHVVEVPDTGGQVRRPTSGAALTVRDLSGQPVTGLTVGPYGYVTGSTPAGVDVVQVSADGGSSWRTLVSVEAETVVAPAWAPSVTSPHVAAALARISVCTWSGETVPVTVVAAVGAASKIGVLIKGGAALESLGAVRTVAPASWGGERLADSKAGAQLARTLDTLKTVGSIIDWFEEVSLPIGVDERGKVIRYRADAMIVLGYVTAHDSTEPALVVRFVDRKRGNMDTRTSAAKRAALRNRGLNVEVIT